MLLRSKYGLTKMNGKIHFARHTMKNGLNVLQQKGGQTFCEPYEISKEDFISEC